MKYLSRFKSKFKTNAQYRYQVLVAGRNSQQLVAIQQYRVQYYEYIQIQSSRKLSCNDKPGVACCSDRAIYQLPRFKIKIIPWLKIPKLQFCACRTGFAQIILSRHKIVILVFWARVWSWIWVTDIYSIYISDSDSRPNIEKNTKFVKAC